MKTSKILFILFISLTFSVHIYSQEVISSAGGYYQNENISLSWTLGEPVIETFEGSGLILTQGFQQPYSFYLSQILNIPAGWSGISGYIDPMNKGIDNLFDNHIPDFIILASMSQFYYPDGGINTIGNWNYETGYKVKASNEFNLTLTGTKIDDPTVNMTEGWNLIPVLTPCGGNTGELFAEMGELIIVKEVAGTGVYWPQFGIGTLAELYPGKSYLALMNDAASLTYPECTKNSLNNNPKVKPANRTLWNDLSYTSASHVIAFPANVLQSSGLQPGDIVGVFTPEGICAGRMDIQNLISSAALLAFGDDETSIIKDGFENGEMLQFKVFRPDGDEEMNLNLEFNTSLPNLGTYSSQGLSAVKSATLVAPSVAESGVFESVIFPNPSHGTFSITLNNWPKNLEIRITDNKGRTIDVLKPENILNGSSLQLNYENLPNGIYFIRLSNNEMVQMKKIVIN